MGALAWVAQLTDLVQALLVVLGALCAFAVDRPAAARMLKRSFPFLLAIAFSASLFTPGELVSGAPWITREGLALAASQSLTFSLFLVAALLLGAMMPPERLAPGLALAFSPLRRFGFSPERLAIRLVLVLQELAAERATRGRTLGAAHPTDASALSRGAELAQPRLCPSDKCLVMFALVLPMTPMIASWLI